MLLQYNVRLTIVGFFFFEYVGFRMATGTASESVCASTGASPAAAPVGTGESAPNPKPPATLALKETSTVVGGGGAANVIIIKEETGEDGSCSAGVEPSTKR
jgi:hypothetical protein